MLVAAYFLASKKVNDDDAELYRLTSRMKVIQKALSAYFDKCGKYPLSIEGLDLLKNENEICHYVPSEEIKSVDFVDSTGKKLIYESDASTYLFKGSEGVERTEKHNR